MIRGGTVVDGTGAPAERADVAIDRGRIVAIGEVDDGGRREIDADGLVVAPGVVDVHTHYDAQLFWDGAATPSSLHGVTTVLAGNCGFSLAPLDPDHVDYLARMLARVEGIPLESLQAGVPWSWRTFGEYLAALDGKVAVNAGFMVGHSTLRRLVLGEDHRRAATPDEVDRIARLLRQSLAAGGLGLSSSLAETHNDGDGRPVPSRYADRAELLALARVTGEHEGTTLEFIPTVAAFFADHDIELMTDMSRAADRSINWNLLNVNTLLWDGSQQRLAAADQAVADGGRIVALMMPMASTLHLDFVTGMVFDSFPGWVDLFEMSLDDRLGALQDPARRARMREGVETADSTVSRRVAQWERIVFGTTFTDATRALEGRSVGSVADERGGHPFDVLLDVVVADQLRTSLVLPPVGDDDESWRLRAQVWSDPRAVIGGSDAGAHVDMIDTFVYSTEMLGPNVRAGRVTLEDAVRLLTSVPAGLYGLRGRGSLVPRCHADVIVFDPATIAAGPRYVRDDMPGGASRLYSDATGIEHVLVNGIPVARAGTLTGDLPGTVLRSARDTDTIRIPR